jgi:hypothetical protein
MKQSIRKFFQSETFLAGLLILLTTVITYGVSIPKLGYYYDDWYLLWSGHSRGAASIIPLFSTDRPFMGIIYSLAYRLLGDQMLNWHLYALLWRFIGALAFFWILRLIWPNHKYTTTLMAVLFVVYPGFLSQPDANTKQNHLYGFGTALLSMSFMLQGMKIQNKVWQIVCTLISVLLTVNYLFIYEYMIGLEGMRLVLLGYVLFQNGFKQARTLAREIFKRWWPYVLASIGFLYWRLFIFEGARSATNATKLAGSYLNDLRHMSIRLIVETVMDFLNTSIFAWFVKPYLLFSSSTYSDMGIAILIAVVILLLVWMYSFLFNKWWKIDRQIDSSVLMKDFIWIGIFIVLGAVFPVIFSDRQIDLTDPYKSYGLHPVGGVVLFVMGILMMFQPKFRNWFLLALIGISVSTQLLNADYWGRFWDYERNTWWQLTWRAPDIQDDTLVMAYFAEGYALQQDYEIWGPVNLIYRPGKAEAPSIQAEVLNEDTAYNIYTGDTMRHRDRDIMIARNFNNLLLISVPSSSSCAHVLDGILPVYSVNEPLLIQQVASYSKVDRIVPTGSTKIPPVQIFGSEPAHDWCFFYQKAALARQTGNWSEIGKLYDQVRVKNLDANDAAEWFPFFEGLVNSGKYDEAKALFNQEIKGQKKVRLPLCALLTKDPVYPPEFHYNYEMINTILCNS